MILKKIHIHNLASIEDAVIDFTERPLKDEPLFLINGPTGSGKSTILDAVCLALFGETPRLYKAAEKSVRFSSPFRDKENGNVVTKNETISLDDVRQIMRRGTGECYAAVVFTTPDGTDYEAKWTARKARNRADGRLQVTAPSLTNLKTGISITKNVAKEVEQLIHLNFEQFCRTSMLAQGEFTKFLQSNSSEKSQILEKLTGTEIYSAISRKIAEMASRKKEEANIALLQLEGIELLSDEQLAETQNRITELEQAVDALGREREVAEGKAKWLEESEKNAATLHEQQEALQVATAESRNEVFLQEARRVQLYRQTEEPRRWRAEMTRHAKNVEEAELLTDDYAQRFDRLQMRLSSLVQQQQTETDSLAQWKEKMSRWNASRCMLEKEQTLLQQLQQAEALLRKASDNERTMEKKKADRPTLEKNIEKAEAGLKLSSGLVEKAQEEIEKAEEAAAAMKPDELQEKNSLLQNRRDNLTQSQADLRIFKQEQSALEEKKTRADNIRQTIERAEAALPRLKSEEKMAQEAHDSTARLYEVMKESISDGFTTVRRKLHQGDTCPLCGQTVDHQVATDSVFEKTVRPLEEAYEEAKSRLTKATSAVMAAKDGLANLRQDLAKADAEVKKAQTRYDAYLDEVARRYSQVAGCQLSPQQYADQTETVEQTLLLLDRDLLAESARLQSDFEQYQEKNKEVNRLRKEKEILLNAENKAKEILSDKKQKLTDLDNDLQRIGKETLQCRDEAEEVLLRVDEMMTYTDWRSKWEADAAAFTTQLQNDAAGMRQADEKVGTLSQRIQIRERSLSLITQTRGAVIDLMPQWEQRAVPAPAPDAAFKDNELAAYWTALLNDTRQWRTEIDTWRRQMAEDEGSIRQFFDCHPDISMDDLEQLARFSAGQIDEIDGRHNLLKQHIAELNGLVRQAQEQQKQLEARKPQLMPGDNALQLRTRMQECETSIHQKQQEMGGLKNQLEEDGRKRTSRQEAFERYKQLHEEEMKWREFSDEFGSTDGSRFRKIAQGFLLDHLLVKANSYLRHFTDRYELLSEPGSLAILVRDRFTNLPPQYVKILSGGETFMVSLSLALALAQLNDTPSAVDTIFIDEGFGTLDPDSLTAVMDTLEKLHQMGGRRVGVVSHVEELRQRISVQVNVRKIDPTRSKVTVTG